METIEAEANRGIDLKEFVPILKVDPIYFESSYNLGPGEGGEKPYRLLAEALAKTQRAAVAELVSGGREQIVIIRPYQGGLVLHGMYYQNEIMDVNQVPRAESERVTDPNVTDKDGLTPLIHAAGRGRLPLVQTLLAYGADVNAKGPYAITAWQVAAGDEVIEVLNRAQKKPRTGK